MSNQDATGSKSKPRSRKRAQQNPRKADKHPSSSLSQAPYSPHDGGNRVPGGYIVMFRRGHTIAKHFEFLGFEFELNSLNDADEPIGGGYYAEMDDQLLNAIRYDPGVELVEDNVYVELD